jgi:hypothetical protein
MLRLQIADRALRSPRAQLTDAPPAVLRLPDGRQFRGELRAISLTGGLLQMPKMQQKHSRMNLLFVTEMGPVLGSVEMLSPVSKALQPFRFISVETLHQQRLRTFVGPAAQAAEDAWIEKYRAAVANRKPQRRYAAIARRSVAALIFLASLVYVLDSHFLR